MERVRGRVRGFRPEWEGSVEGWVVKFCSKNKWRVMPFLDFDDLYQEAYAVFAHCRDTYPAVVDPPHFMTLFMRAFVNRVTSLAQKRSRDRVFSYDEDGEMGPPSSDDVLYKQQKTCPEMLGIDLTMLVEDAPQPIKELIDTVLKSPDDIVGFIRDSGLRETLKDRLARLGNVKSWVGYSVNPQACEADFVAQVRAWASGV